MKKLTHVYHTAAPYLVFASFAYCAGALGKLVFDWCVETGRAQLKACDCKK